MVDVMRLARHSDAMLQTEGIAERGPLRIPTNKLHEQGDTVSAESLVEEVRADVKCAYRTELNCLHRMLCLGEILF